MPPTQEELDSDKAIDEMAGKILVNRGVFEQLYDPVVEPKLPEVLQFRALSALRNREVPGLKDDEKNRADYACALRQLRDNFLLLPFFGKHAAKLFADPEKTITLQVFTNPKQPLLASLPLTQALITALRRTCRITCDKGPGVVPDNGSGFLIGPHLVLTNWHVVKSMLTDAGQEKQDSFTKIKVEFDALVRPDGRVEKVEVFRPVENWRVDSRTAHQDEVNGGGTGPNAPWPDAPDVLAQNLDFAIVELDGTPGYDRGWYELDPQSWPQAGQNFDLFQFPLGLAMKCMPGQFVAPTVFADNNEPPRILHNVNTAGGSSGGLCLDLTSAQAMALHQAGYLIGGIPTNVAIPLARIAGVAGQTVRQRIANAPRVARMGPGGVPILGRGQFQRLIDDAIRGRIRIVAVQTSFDDVTRQPRQKIGKSFSTFIMQALLPPADNVLFTVPAARLSSDAYAAARIIVETVNRQLLDKIPPQAPAGQSSLDADAIGNLVTPVIDAMCAAAGNGLLWLVIDDLDRNPVLSESTTSTFLNALYKAAASQSKLRIVLIGPTGALPGLIGLPFGADLINQHIIDDEIATWISAELGPRIPVVPQLAMLMAIIARSVAEELANDPLKGRTGAIAQVLRTHWAPKIQAQG
jgi:hypothetical protein